MFQKYVPKEYGDLHSSSKLVVKVSAVHRKVKGSIPVRIREFRIF